MCNERRIITAWVREATSALREKVHPAWHLRQKIKYHNLKKRRYRSWYFANCPLLLSLTQISFDFGDKRLCLNSRRGFPIASEMVGISYGAVCGHHEEEANNGVGLRGACCSCATAAAAGQQWRAQHRYLLHRHRTYQNRIQNDNDGSCHSVAEEAKAKEIFLDRRRHRRSIVSLSVSVSVGWYVKMVMANYYVEKELFTFKRRRFIDWNWTLFVGIELSVAVANAIPLYLYWSTSTQQGIFAQMRLGPE